MAAKLTSIPILVFLILFTITNPIADAEDIDNNDNGSLHLMNETLDLEWQFQTQFHLQPENVEDEDEMHRRSLYWKSPAPTRYYISYGALSANRVPCPPRSGRSYYTPNCFRARGPVHPYTRGCSAITRCRRWKTLPYLFPSLFCATLILLYSFLLPRNIFFFFFAKKKKNFTNHYYYVWRYCNLFLAYIQLYLLTWLFNKICHVFVGRLEIF